MSHIHFKSLAGNILSIPFDHEDTIESVRATLAQLVVSEPQHIVILDPEDTDLLVPPTLQPDGLYYFIVRDSNTLRPSFRQDEPVRDMDTGRLYYKYTFFVFDMGVENSLKNTFSIYYDRENNGFINQDSVEETAEGCRLIHPIDHISLSEAIFHALRVPWYDRRALSQRADDLWHDTQIEEYTGEHEYDQDYQEDWFNLHELRGHADDGPFDLADE